MNRTRQTTPGKLASPGAFVPTQNPLTFAGPLAELPMETAAQAPGGGNSLIRDWVAQNHEGPYERTYGRPTDPLLTVPDGQLTFDAEGTEGGPFHSRTPHWPGGGSGVTIGRGYDLGQGRSAASIREDLTAAGLTPEAAQTYSAAANKKGSRARRHLAANGDSMPEISLEQQKALFATTFEDEAAEVRRISTKDDVVERYGTYDLDAGDPAIRDLMVDLKFRGDYRPDTRTDVQPLAVDNDLRGLAANLNDRGEWANVPRDRFERRAAYANEAVEELDITENLPLTFAAPFEQLGNPNLDFHGRPKVSDNGE